MPGARTGLAWVSNGDADFFPSIAAFLRRSSTYLRPYLGMEILILLGQLVVLTNSIVNPLSYSILIDRAITPRDLRLLALVIGGLVLLFVIQSLASLYSEYLNARVSASVLTDIRLQLFQHLQRLSLDFYSRARVGDLMSRFSNDLFVVQYAMTGALIDRSLSSS